MPLEPHDLLRRRASGVVIAEEIGQLATLGGIIVFGLGVGVL